MGVTREQRGGQGRREPVQRAAAGLAQLRELRRKYDELWAKHRVLVRQASRTAAERSGMVTLALFALRVADSAVAIAVPAHVLFRNGRWHELERDRTPWRATARDPVAPATAPTLVHLVTRAAEALLARSAPPQGAGRYERPERGDAFDVRFERLEGRGMIGMSIRDVTRLVAAERGLARRATARRGESAPRRGGSPRRRGRATIAPRS